MQVFLAGGAVPIDAIENHDTIQYTKNEMKMEQPDTPPADTTPRSPEAQWAHHFREDADVRVSVKIDLQFFFLLGRWWLTLVCLGQYQQSLLLLLNCHLHSDSVSTHQTNNNFTTLVCSICAVNSHVFFSQMLLVYGFWVVVAYYYL